MTKSLADSQEVIDFTTYTEYFGLGNENLEYFAADYVEKPSNITVSLT